MFSSVKTALSQLKEEFETQNGKAWEDAQYRASQYSEACQISATPAFALQEAQRGLFNILRISATDTELKALTLILGGAFKA